MKKILLLLFFGFFYCSVINAQVSFSCIYRQYCHWNPDSEEFENCEGYEESSLFVLSENETMFTHTTESLKSTYFVTSKEYDADKEIWTYDVTSDVGNDYYYIFDPKNKQVRAVFVQDGETLMVIFTVKAVF
jgi:hypothetical protein